MSNRVQPKNPDLRGAAPGHIVTSSKGDRFRPGRKLNRRRARMYKFTKSYDKKIKVKSAKGYLDSRIEYLDSELRRPDHYPGRGGW